MYKLVNLNLILSEEVESETDSEILLQDYLIEHIVDMLLYNEKISVLNYLTGLSKEKEKLSAYFAGIFWNLTNKKSYN